MAKKRATLSVAPPDASEAKAYDFPKATQPMRPEIGVQRQFAKPKPPKIYRYDSSLAPQLFFDENPVREKGEELIGRILGASSLEEAKHAASELRALGKPFLDWTGKAEKPSLAVPTLPLFIHERLSTKAIIETIQDRKLDKQQEFDFFADPKHSVTDQILRAYEHRDRWVNRLILGDSLLVMNSLLEYEGMSGKIQTIYFDPPYGVRFGSNFQPFVRKREVKHGDDSDLTREPEMVQAYRDTWELGLHSYLSYLRDRLLLCRELLTESGSLFLQISDENVHHVREIMDEVFGTDCFVVTIQLKKKGSQKSSLIDPVNDYILWYSKSPRDSGRVKFRPYYVKRELDADTLAEFRMVELPDGREFPIKEVPNPKGEKQDYRLSPKQLFVDYPGARLFRSNPITSGGVFRTQIQPVKYKGRTFVPGPNNSWKVSSMTDEGSPSGMDVLKEKGRLIAGDEQLSFKRYIDDFGYISLSNWWDGLGGASDPIYVVQTNSEVLQRCILMTSDPGDLVLDPTSGSGTTAYVAENWGRRWIAIDTSRVPIALARQRLLTATYPYFELKDESAGPAAGFVYKRRQNRAGQEVGGIVPHITLGSIANHEKAVEEVICDRPEKVSGITRVTGPFVMEAIIPAPFEVAEGKSLDQSSNGDGFHERLLKVLAQTKTIHLEGNKQLKLKEVKRPSKSLSISGEAIAINGRDKRIAFVFGPEHGAITELLVFEAAKEAKAKDYDQLVAIGFAIEPNARLLIDNSDKAVGIPSSYVQATPDLLLGDLLKTTRSSQIFSVCGLPDFEIERVGKPEKSAKPLYRVVLKGLDSFDPETMQNSSLDAKDVPAWFLDSNHNKLVFHVDQAFFPRTGAWDNLRKALKGVYEDKAWNHLSGVTSAPFEAGSHGLVAVKVVDHRGNELVAIKTVKEAK